ncbi:50S ribosomal protein L21e [uncultured archaeon]|nr:50S ribosomal protein L21e [uncultured archaeon]
MARSSKGRMNRRSRLLGRNARRRDVTVSERMHKLEVGTKVQLVPNAKYEDFPSPRYAGRVGTVVGKQGSAYVVELKDGSLTKRFITTAIHLKSC